jgi:hypothetical protein
MGHSEVQCQHCGFWFPSPVNFTTWEDFMAGHATGSLVNCPMCGKPTAVDKKNMRFME